jgi:hypothetical protein
VVDYLNFTLLVCGRTSLRSKKSRPRWIFVSVQVVFRIQPIWATLPEVHALKVFTQTLAYWSTLVPMEMADSPRKEDERASHNRRAFPRWPLPFDLLYGKGTERRSTNPVEIGEGGVSFKTNSEIPVDTEIHIEFRLGPEQEWVHVKGIVRHVDNKLVGVEFLNLRMADRLRIVDFMSLKK